MNRAPARERKLVIFCDFDGTITVSDNIVSIIKHFNPPGWESIVSDVIAERKSIRQGVGELFRLLPSSRQAEVIDYAISNVRIRDGFERLIEYCKDNSIEFYVTSGGIDFFVYPILSRFHIPSDHIFCNGSEFTSPQIEITWPHPCDDECAKDCGMCKTTIMRRFPPEKFKRILIGDSVTDFEGAKLADLVFSRSHLSEKCRELGLAFVPFETFHEITDFLKSNHNNMLSLKSYN